MSQHHRAYLVEHVGLPSQHRICMVRTPQPSGSDVLLSVRAAGVNYPDTLIIQGKYQFQPELPFSPGSEVSGIVLACGPDVKGFGVGDRVIANVPVGGFSEKLLVDSSRLMHLPSTMSYVEGATFTLAYGTALYALKDVAQIKPGESLLVMGASGGVGLAAVELGKLMGAHVIACASSAAKLEACRRQGADALIRYHSRFTNDAGAAFKAAIREAAGSGVDVCFDPIGGQWCVDPPRASLLPT